MNNLFEDEDWSEEEAAYDAIWSEEEAHSDLIPVEEVTTFEVEMTKGGGVQYLHPTLLKKELPSGDSKAGFEGGAPPSQDAHFCKGSEGGHSPSPLQKVLSCSDEATHKAHDSAITDKEQDGGDKSLLTDRSPSVDMKEAKEVAQWGDPKGYDAVNTEVATLESWVSHSQDEVVDYFKCRHFEMWKDTVAMTPPSHASGKVAYYIAAFHALRKDKYMWEKMVVTDGHGQWVGVDEDILEAYIAGFFAGIGMTAHLGSLSKSRKLVSDTKRDLESLPWSQGMTYTDDIHQWVSTHLHVDTDRIGSYCVTSKELFTAYKLTTEDYRMTAQGFGMKLSRALQTLHSHDCTGGTISKTKNVRYTPLCGTVTKSAGWLGIKLALSDEVKLLVKEELGALTPREFKKLYSR